MSEFIGINELWGHVRAKLNKPVPTLGRSGSQAPEGKDFNSYLSDLADLRNFGCKWDCNEDRYCGMASGSDVLTASGPRFTASDVGKTVAVYGAGTAGAGLVTTISAFISNTQ